MKTIYLHVFGVITLLSAISTTSSVAQPAGTLAPPSFSTCTPTLLQQNSDVTRNLFGTDSQFPEMIKKVQLFEIDDNTSFDIVGALVWIGYLKVNGSPGNISFDVVDFCGFTGMNLGSKQAGFTVPNQDSPESTIGKATVKSTSSLKASACLDDANVIVFDTPVTVYDNTCLNKVGLGIDFSAIGDDVFGMYSTNITEGALNPDYTYKELAWETDGSSSWYTILANTDGQVNADILVFPIINMNTYNAGGSTGVCSGSKPNAIENETSFFNGLKLSQNYPNPTHDLCVVQYEIEEEGNVSLFMYDMKGTKIKSFQEGFKNKGLHTISIDISDVASGDYIYLLVSGNKRLANKMTIVK